MNRLVILVDGGVVQGVYTDSPDIQVIVADRDNHEAGDPLFGQEIPFKLNEAPQDVLEALVELE